ncbi:MAG TPA: HEPN domain-containing protein [Thermoplasmata archaeon]|nr:HEPN domain-containing protein [Thermoplasmata archaeon]
MVRELKFDFDDCVKEGLLRRIPPSKGRAEGSMKAALRWLEEGEKDSDGEAFASSVLSSYLAMFHSARAILFFDGFRERSHYCIARYLEERYVKTSLLERKWIELLDHYRELRHEGQYSVSFFATKDEAKSASKTAKEFVERMKKLMQEVIETEPSKH